MNKVAMLAVVLGIPASLLAELNINVKINGYGHVCRDYCNHEYEEEYVDVGEPWFEDEFCEGPVRTSFEYQWTLLGSRHVLRYRKVSFNPLINKWSFGVWLIRDRVCHSSCRLHHAHVYFQPKRIAPLWKRHYHRDGGNVTYYYEYRNKDIHHKGHPQVYRYEYKPEKRGHRERGIPEVSQKRQHEDRYQKKDDHNRSGGLNRRSSSQQNNSHSHKDDHKKSSYNGISKVSGRERLR
ncbi:MAG: hypothetical protein GX640_15525 [Fibrobacter sp.]|nr:hypothetical protein [Fibrobacter sp.]